MIRWVAFIVGGLALAVLIAAGTGFLLLDRFDLAPFAARRATASLHRSVTIAGLHVTPGRWVTIRLSGVQVANLPDGTRPDMGTLQTLTAEIDALSLLHGPAIVRRLEIEGLSVLLERVGGETRNWRFDDGPPRAGGNNRSGFPTLLDVHVKASDITVQTSKGHTLQTVINDGTISTGSPTSPVKLALRGTYRATPVSLDALLQPIAMLRDASIPYGTDIHITSGDVMLRFEGTMTKPLEVDGAQGKLTLHAPAVAPILTMSGAPADAFKAAVDLSGTLTRADTVWTLADATGQLDDNPLAPSMLRFTDGGHGHPDDVALDLAFERINLDHLLAARGAGKGPDTPMQVQREPDPRLNIQIATRQLSYAGNGASGVRLKLAVRPGQIAVDELAAVAFGAKLQASGHADSADKGGRFAAAASVSGVDVQQLRRLTGGGAVPLTGRLDAQASAEGAGDSLDAAVRTAHVAAVLWMTSGSISRDVIEKASVDIRRLFRKPTGMAPVTCLLGVFEMHKGAGTLSPIRIRTADGTIAGQGAFDLGRNQIDMTIGSQASTTSAFALDVPVRISGNINNPDVHPSTRSAVLAVADLTKLPPPLRAIVERNPCAR